MSKLKLVRYFKYRNPNNAVGLTHIVSGGSTTEANKSFAWSSDSTKLANFKTNKEANWDTADIDGVYYGSKEILLYKMLVDLDASTVNGVYAYTVFGDVDEAKLKIGIDSSCITAASPTVTYDLQDSDTTLKITMAFDSASDRTNSKAHWDARFSANAYVMAVGVEWFKTEWVDENDNITVTTDPRTGS